MNAPSQPTCFGRHWDPNHAECKGGLDPAYTNPVTGTKLRDKCSWFSSCQHATASGPAPTPQVIPTRSLLPRPAVSVAPPPKPEHPAYTPPRPPTYSAPQVQYTLPPATTGAPPATQVHHPQYAQYAPQQQVMQHPQPTIGMVPPHVAQYGPQYVYTPYQAPGSQMPQYLTVPEPVRQDVHWGARLGHELLRSVVKAFGHQLAAYVDSNPFRRHNT